MAAVSKLRYRSNPVPIRIPSSPNSPTEIDKQLGKFMWKCKGPEQLRQFWKRTKLEDSSNLARSCVYKTVCTGVRTDVCIGGTELTVQK